MLSGITSLLSAQAYAAQEYVNSGNVGANWQLDNMPQSAQLSDFMFRFMVNQSTLHQEGTCSAQQFYFAGENSNKNAGYLGLQPRKNKHGKSRMKAIFSTFIAGSDSRDGNCHPAADGGPGVSCAIEFNAEYGRNYEITVHKNTSSTWSGELKDTVSGEEVHIGSWQLPVGKGYPQFKVPGCLNLARINVLFGPVSTSNYHGAVGNITNAHGYNSNECQGEAAVFILNIRISRLIYPTEG